MVQEQMPKEVNTLILSERFFPLTTASAQRAFAYAKTLALHSYETTVITKSQRSFESQKVTVIGLNPKIEIPIFNPILLLLYLIKSISLIRRHQIDLIISTVPMIDNAIAGFLLSKYFKVPHIIDVRDFWESAFLLYPLNRIAPTRLTFLLIKTTSLLYQHANAIVTVNETLKNMLTKRRIPHNRIYIIPNGADTSLFKPCTSEKRKKRLRKKYKLPLSKILFVYGGSLSPAYRFDIVLKGISCLQESNNFMLLIIGKPTMLMTKGKILQTIWKLGLERKVKIMDPQPVQRLAELLKCCEVGIIPLDEKNFLKPVITAKIFAYLSSGLPILASGPKGGELQNFLTMYKVGFFIEKATPQRFAEGFKRFLQQRSKIKDMGSRGRKIVEKHYDRYALSRGIIEVIHNTIGSYHTFTKVQR